MDLQIDFANLDFELLDHRCVCGLNAAVLYGDSDRVLAGRVRRLVDRGDNAANGRCAATVVRKSSPYRSPAIGLFIEQKDLFRVKSAFAATN